jgi:hypothetical protein
MNIKKGSYRLLPTSALYQHVHFVDGAGLGEDRARVGVGITISKAVQIEPLSQHAQYD